MEYYVIATDNVENIVKYDCLVALMEDFSNIDKCWKVSVYEGEIEEVKDFDKNKLQAYYAHASGMFSCKLDCPEYIKKAIENA